MAEFGARVLVLGGALSALASVAHLACIVLGAPAYRFMGASERMVEAVEAGKFRPTLVTLVIASTLFLWAVYAFSAAGIAPRLPLTKPVLVLISVVYLVRAFAFPLLRPAFPQNSNTFWFVSSGICLVLGLVYTAGLIATWAQ